MHVVVIGAGPQALAVLAALATNASWPERVTVVDPHDRWCEAWDAKLSRLDLDRLRSPQVHHPGPRPMALRDLVETLPPAEQVALRRPEAERVPTPLGMRRYLDHLVDGLGPITWLRGLATALSVSPLQVTVAPLRAEPGSATPRGAADDATPLVLRADAVVAAHNPSMPRVPEWAAPLIASGAAQHASEVDVRSADLAGREVLIVGGGLTAACLALASLERGARPTLLTRRALRARPYDVDASWIGPRQLAPYLRASVRERRARIDVARDGGTVPPATLAALRAAADDPRRPLTLLEAVDVERQVRERRASRSQAPPLVWLATGFVQDLAADPLLLPIAAELGVPIYGGLPEVDAHLRLGGAPIYVAGPYAALGIGPACRNLAGARPAAQRIAASIGDLTAAAPSAS